MSTIAERILSDCVGPKSQVREIEPHIYSAAPDNSLSNTYDTDFGNIYEWVACNPIYNRVVWGYPITLYPRFTYEALSSANTGPVLDLACGSLAFTAKAYLQSPHRTIICTDQSLKMLRLARNRLVSLQGSVPDNLVFLLADALRLPLLPKCITLVRLEAVVPTRAGDCQRALRVVAAHPPARWTSAVSRRSHRALRVHRA